MGGDVGVEFDSLGFASDYSQVVDGHYYYMRTDGMGNYTVYRDKGEEAVRFIISAEHYIEYFVKYGDVFYAFVREDDFSSGFGDLDNTLVSIDVKTGNVTKVKDMTVEVAGQGFWLTERAVFYKDFFYFEDYSDYYGVHEVGRGRLASLHLDGNMEKKRFPLASRMESMKEKPILTFIDGKIYYGEQQDRTVTLFSYDLGSGVEKEVLCYERTNDKYGYVGEIKIDQDYIYCQDYMIPRRGGEMQQMPKALDFLNFTPDGKYLLYVDRKFRLHRISRKTHKDVVICNDIQIGTICDGMRIIGGIDCTRDGIYIKGINEAWLETLDEDSLDDWADPRSNDLYYMDFDGKNRKRICKAVTELSDEFYENY